MPWRAGMRGARVLPLRAHVRTVGARRRPERAGGLAATVRVPGDAPRWLHGEAGRGVHLRLALVRHAESGDRVPRPGFFTTGARRVGAEPRACGLVGSLAGGRGRGTSRKDFRRPIVPAATRTGADGTESRSGRGTR